MRIDTVYFWIKPKEKSNSVAFQANLIPHAYTSNVPTWPMNIVTTYSDVIILVNIPVHQFREEKKPRIRASTNPTNIWRVSSQDGLTPFWAIWDIWDLSCWNIRKIIRQFVILLIITSKIFTSLPLYNNEKGIIRNVLFCITRWCPYF